jgi:hypothetical protein
VSIDALYGIAIANTCARCRTIRVQLVGDQLALSFEPPGSVVRNGVGTLDFVVVTGEDDRRHREYHEDAGGETSLKFPVHGLEPWQCRDFRGSRLFLY